MPTINIRTDGFRCPNHGAMFAPTATGRGGQRTRDLQSYPVTYNAGAGTLTIG
jgi:Rieske Fe-S protein